MILDGGVCAQYVHFIDYVRGLANVAAVIVNVIGHGSLFHQFCLVFLNNYHTNRMEHIFHKSLLPDSICLFFFKLNFCGYSLDNYFHATFIQHALTYDDGQTQEAIFLLFLKLC